MAAILGIDLGTTNSSAAVFDGRDVLLIPNDRGSRMTPSVIALSEDGDILVGESARNQALVHPGRTIRSAKRLMGSSRTLSFGDGDLRPEEAAAHILSRLKADAESFLGEEIREAVITVPAYFSENQRRATREAGRIAGLEVRRLLNEPTSAAIAWAWSSNRFFGEDSSERHVLVYDLGGGTFDTTVLAMKGKDCRVLSTCGDNNLGGDDFDKLLFSSALDSFSGTIGADRLQSDPVLLQQLSDLVERSKIELSTRETAMVVLPFAPIGKSVHPSWKILREDFERTIAPLIDRTIDLVGKAVGESGLSLADIDQLVLSGGSSRIPLVRRRLNALLGREAVARVNPEEIVAIGAAIFAALGGGKDESLHVQDALSRSFGVEIDGDESLVLIDKNTAVPFSKKRVFTTVSDQQSSVEIHILQGEQKKASGNLSLGRFLLSGIRSAPRGEPRIELEFSIDPDEILHVRARDLDTGANQALTIAAAPDGAIPASAGRLRALAARLRVLSQEVETDRNLELELAEALDQAEKLSRGYDRGDTDGHSSAETIALTLEALVAELEARKRLVD